MNKIWNNKWLFALIIVLILVNATFTALLWNKMHHKRPGHYPPMADRGAFLPELLQIDSLQEIQYKSLSEKHFAKMDTLKAMEFMLREALYSLVDSVKIDSQILQQKTRQLALIQQQIHEQTILHFRELKSICRGDQLNKLKDLLHRSVLRDIGPARFIQAMTAHTRDSILKSNPDWFPGKNREHIERPHSRDGEPEDHFPPDPHHRRPGPPPHESPHYEDGPPPPPFDP